MKAGFRIGPVELAVSTPPGPLERIISARYRWFLGAVRSPALWLILDPMSSPGPVADDAPTCRVSGTEVDLLHPLFDGRATAGRDGRVRVVPTAAAIDGLFETLVAVLAPARSALLLDAAAVISEGAGHLVLGGEGAVADGLVGGGRVLLSPVRVLLTQEAEGWGLEATPFRVPGPWPSRSATAQAVWFADRVTDASEPVSGALVTGTLLEHTLLPLRDTATLAKAFDVASRAGEQVPGATLPAGRGWKGLDAVGTALQVRRALATAQPELQARLLHRALDAGT